MTRRTRLHFRAAGAAAILGAIVLVVVSTHRQPAAIPDATIGASSSATAPIVQPIMVTASNPAVVRTSAEAAPQPGPGVLAARIHARLRALMERQTDDDHTHDEVMRELLGVLRDDNVAAIVSALTPKELATDFGTAAVIRWLHVDPGAAATWLPTRLELSNDQGWLIGHALLDTPVAIDLLCHNLPDGSWKQSLLTGAALGAADSDPVGAIALADRMAAGNEQTSAYETIAYAWVVADPVAAENWVSRVEPAELRGRLLATGAKALAATDPDLAATWLVAAVRSGAVLNEATLTIVEAWSTKDPAAAAAWVGGLPPEGPRLAAIEQVFQNWLKTEPAAAQAWLMRLPDRAEIIARLEADEAERSEPKP